MESVVPPNEVPEAHGAAEAALLSSKEGSGASGSLVTGTAASGTATSSGAGRFAEEEHDKKEGLPLAQAVSLAPVSLSMPLTAYGAVIMLPLILDHTNTRIRNLQICEAWARILVNYVLQGSLLYHVYLMWNWNDQQLHTDCVPGGDTWWIFPTLWFTCMWIFVLSVVKDMGETLVIGNIVLYHIKTVEAPELFRYCQKEGELELVSGGMSPMQKGVMMVCVVIPKMIIAVGCLIFGGGYLAVTSSNADMLLNSLAVLFILDLDELVFEIMTPRQVRRLLEEVPPFESDVRSVQARFERYGGALFNTVFSAVVVIIFYACVDHCQRKWESDPWEANW